MTALIGFEFCRCGPRQRSVKSPCVYSVMSPSAVSTSSTLYGSPSASKRAFASSREISSRVHSRPFLQLAVRARPRSLEVLLVDRLREVEVVVEAVLDRRPDRDLHARVEAAHRLGEQMRGRVAEHVERVGVARVARREDLDRLPVLERQRADPARCAVRADEHRLLGELRPDRARGVEAGRAVGEFELRVVGKENVHGGQGYAPP